jgi:hypothetical protein
MFTTSAPACVCEAPPASAEKGVRDAPVSLTIGRVAPTTTGVGV